MTSVHIYIGTIIGFLSMNTTVLDAVMLYVRKPV